MNTAICLHVCAMQSLADFFGVSDSSQLQWAHAVNDSQQLKAVCADPAVHVVEGDVQFASDDALPCLAHAWQDIADLDLQTWLAELSTAGKAVKLDFGSAEAVEPTLSVIQRMRLTTPVILHANVFSLLNGEGRDDTMEPEQYIRLCQQYCPHAILSLGWSLRREHDADGRVEDVLIHQVADMALKRLGPVSYAVEIRGGYTSGWERGAALIFDPLPALPPADDQGATATAPNVVQATHLFRRVA